MSLNTTVVIGGAGFIGSHLVKRLLDEDSEVKVIVVDNLRSGSWNLLAPVLDDPRLLRFEESIESFAPNPELISDIDAIYHFASNAEIALAQDFPDVDFWHGTALTNAAVELWRKCENAEFIYASGSGVYGDAGASKSLCESDGGYPIVSTYAASKIAGEALVEAYAYLFDRTATIFRFGNVVGPAQTHGVVFDFIKKLLADPDELVVWGDGTQTKPYVHVTDVVQGLLTLRKNDERAARFNLATDDVVSVSEIVEIVTSTMGLAPSRVSYGSDNRGWKGDIPVVVMSAEKARAHGWKPMYSGHSALVDSAASNLASLSGNL